MKYLSILWLVISLVAVSNLYGVIGVVLVLSAFGIMVIVDELVFRYKLYRKRKLYKKGE